VAFVSFAQNAEDLLLWRALRHVGRGFWIDVGAADPDEWSVTRAFHDRGWTGINIEPAPHYFDRLRKLRPGEINLRVAVGAQAGNRPFHLITGTGLSTFDASIAESHARAGFAVERTAVEVTTLAEICRWHVHDDIHFLKIDVEGAEAEVLAGGDFGRYRPWIVLVESTLPLTSIAAEAGWEANLLAQGYVFVWFDGLNRFYVAIERHAELSRHFQAPPNHLDDWILATDYEGRRQLEVVTEALEVARRDQARSEAEIARQRAAITAALAARDEAIVAGHAAATEAAWLRRPFDVEPTPDEASEAVVVEPVVAPAMADELSAQLVAAPLAIPAPRTSRRILMLMWRCVRPVARPIAWRIRGFMTAEIRADLHRLIDAPRPAAPEPTSFDLHKGSSAPTLAPPLRPLEARRPARRAIHQFHPSVALGDAVTNGMILTRDKLRGLGFQSEIYAEHRVGTPEAMARPMDELPLHDDYVLLVHHSLGYERADELARHEAPKVLVYHNITPSSLLGDAHLRQMADLGRAQLGFWRDHVMAAIGISALNTSELRRAGFPVVSTCQLLFDVRALRALASSSVARRDRADEQCLTILFVGRIVLSKGQADLVDAFAAFRARVRRPSRLVLVGRVFAGAETYEAEIKRRIQRHRLVEHVELTGAVDDHTLHDWYAQADLYASMSRHEGFGVPLVEAMAHGVPIAALEAGSVSSTVGAGGIIVGSLTGMVDAMQALTTDPARRAAILKAQPGELERFAWDRQMPGLLDALIAAGAARPGHPTRDPSPASLSVTVAGHVNGSYSLASANRALVLALEEALPGRVGLLPVEAEAGASLDDVPAAQWGRLEPLLDRPRSQVIISQHYPIWVPPQEGQLRAAFVFWEESLLPEGMVETLNDGFDVVLTPSRFVATALVDSGVTTTVKLVGFAPMLDGFTGLAARRERDKDRPFTFLHVSSAFPRKGLDVLLAAYARAFGRGEPVRLVIKTFPNPHNDTARQLTDLKAAFPDLCEIVHLDKELTPSELENLYAGADAMVLPTRGEGFNIPAAEAIAADIPLIVSAVGGHRDFVGPDTAALIEGTFAPSATHLSSPGSLWFEPDRDSLVAALRDAVDRPEAGRARAANARASILQALDPGRFGTALADTLSGLLNGPPVATPLSRVAMMTTWGVRCGIAEYSASLVSALPPGRTTLSILADTRTEAAARVVPAWRAGEQFAVGDVAHEIARIDPQVLMIQHQPGLFAWERLADLLGDARLLGRTVTITLHNTRSLEDIDPAAHGALMLALGRADRLIVHAPEDVNRLRRWDVQNVVMIPQGTPAPHDASRPVRALPPGAAPVIGAYGFLLPPKNFGALIETLKIVRRTWPKATLRMVTALYDQGLSEEEHHRLRRLAHDIGVGNEIDWHTGFLPPKTSLELLGGCDLLVLPYKPTPEASSAALRTALASLVPTAVTPIDIFREAGDAVARLPGDTPEQMANGIATLLRDDDHRRALIDRQRAWLDNRSWSRTSARSWRLIEALHAQRTKATEGLF
jgi:FkbM family methyltransferase